jgi:hypothetical protein
VLLTELDKSCHDLTEQCYGALMASAWTDLQRAEKRQSFGFEIRWPNLGSGYSGTLE